MDLHFQLLAVPLERPRRRYRSSAAADDSMLDEIVGRRWHTVPCEIIGRCHRNPRNRRNQLHCSGGLDQTAETDSDVYGIPHEIPAPVLKE